jgi:hypothetical protein
MFVNDAVKLLQPKEDILTLAATDSLKVNLTVDFLIFPQASFTITSKVDWFAK